MLAPFAVAAVVLCVAAVAKLRAPEQAAVALAAVGLPVSVLLIRLFAAGELALGGTAALAPSRPIAAALAFVYAGFAGFAMVLSRRGAACGCFGAPHAPASPIQAVLSAVLSAVAFAAAAAGVHGVDWMLHRSVASGIVLMVGVAGAAYGTVVAYSQMPSAWTAWSGS